MDELITAIKNNNVERVRSLLDSGVDPKYEEDEDDDGNPLHYAADLGNLEIVKLLVEHGADTKNTIYDASLMGHVEVVRFLLDNGIEIGEYDIAAASKHGHVEIVKMLLENGAKPDNDALVIASKKGYTEIVRLLLKHDAYPSAEALTNASRYGHVEIVRLLLAESQSDTINPVNALKWATKNGHTKVVRLLLKHPRLRKSEHVKEIMKKEHNYIMESSMAMKSLNLPPYVLGQILSENVAAYDLGNIAEFITPILQPTMENNDGERVKRPHHNLISSSRRK